MNKAVLLILTGTLAMLASGCSLFSNFADSQKDPEENLAKPIPVQVNAAQPNDEPEAEFADLEDEIEPVQEIAGLIPATNPDVRVRNSVRGRQDPFSVVTLNPRIEIEEEESRSEPPTSRFSQRPAPSDNNDDSQSADLPEPTLAQEVIISGLYESNGTTKLIVQAPEEDTSRYVEVGQYLSNGQILVKRIEQDSFASPIIILEESGIEVAKAIGEGVEDDADSISLIPANTSINSLSSTISLSSN
ncbi:MAG: hypothetical protein AAF383_10840 [Cyanobacteria bacterium P01_A01_bin.83]